MGSFASKKTTKVELPNRPGEYIEVRSKFGVAAKAELQDTLVAVDGLDTDEQEVRLHAGRYTLAVLQAGVVGWRLAWDEESGLPEDPKDPGYTQFKPDYIGTLDEEDELVDATLVRIAELNPTLGQGRKQSSAD